MIPDPPRIGNGFDAHRLGGDPPVKFGGVVVDTRRGLLATSDGDVVAHAVIDALLGAAALGDIGMLCPSSDPKWRNADSMAVLASVVEQVIEAGFHPSNLDLTVVAETVRVAPFRSEIRTRLAIALGLAEDRVSVKATTTDGLGFAGRDEGVAAWACVLLSS